MYLIEVSQIVVGCIVLGSVLGIVAWFVTCLVEEATEESLRLTEEQQLELQRMRQETELMQKKISQLGHHRERGHVSLDLMFWMFGIGAILAVIGVVREHKFSPSLCATMTTVVAAVLFTIAGMACGAFYLVYWLFGGGV